MASMIDLHIHTTASDGSDSPAELARRIAGAGLKLFSVTDHDTIDGALEMEALVPAGIRFVRGVEFSCVSPAGKCHILGYGYDPAHPAFRSALEEGRQLRLAKMRLRLEYLRQDFCVELTEEESRWLWSRKSPGRPHLARILMARGMASSVNDAIEKYLPEIPGRDRIGAQTAVTAILAAGGIPVWAHPLGGEGEKRLSRAQFDAMLAVLTGYGLRGMECWYSRYDRLEIDFLLDQASARGLAVTGGSDYHGSSKQGIALGQLSRENSGSGPAFEALTTLFHMV